MHLGRLIRLAGAAFALCEATACSAGYPPPPKPATRSSAPAGVNAVSIRRRAGTWHYLRTDLATIRLATDTTDTTTTLKTSAQYTLMLVQTNHDDLQVEAHIDSSTTESSHQRIPAGVIPTTGLTAKLSKEGRLINAQYLDQAPCTGGTSPAVARLHDFFIPVPDPLPPDNSWTDTTMVTVCQGAIPVTIKQIDHYMVAADSVFEHTHALLHIKDSSSTTIAGRARRPNSAIDVIITGSGIRSGDIHLEAQTGMLHSARGTTALTLTISADGTTYTFSQDDSTSIRQTTP